MTTAVIGAGVAGLVAAHTLLSQGEQVILIEPGLIGGMVRSSQRDGWTLEEGPNVLVERAELRELIESLGLRESVRYPVIEKYRQFVWWKGAPRLVPKSPLQLVQSDLFPLPLKLALPLRFFSRGLLRPQGEDESVLTFFSRLLGQETARAVLDPVLKGIYGGDIERLSARSIFPLLWQAARDGVSLAQYLKTRKGAGSPKVMTFDGGIQTLTDALYASVASRVSSVTKAATAVTRSEQGFSVLLDDGSTVECTRVILTPSGSRLANLISPLSSPCAEKLSKVQYASLAMVHLSVPASERLLKDAFGVLFPGGMKEHLLGVMFKSLIFPGVAPSGTHLLSVVLGGAQAGDYYPDEKRLAEVTPLLVREFLGVRSSEWLGCTVWKNAIPQLNVGHYAVVETLDAVEKENPGLVVASVDRGGVGVSDRIRIAREGVSRLRLAAG